jgi:hypothetical protein
MRIPTYILPAWLLYPDMQAGFSGKDCFDQGQGFQHGEDELLDHIAKICPWSTAIGVEQPVRQNCRVACMYTLVSRVL